MQKVSLTFPGKKTEIVKNRQWGVNLEN